MLYTIVIELGAFLSHSVGSAAHHPPVKVLAAGYGAAGGSAATRSNNVGILQIFTDIFKSNYRLTLRIQAWAQGILPIHTRSEGTFLHR